MLKIKGFLDLARALVVTVISLLIGANIALAQTKVVVVPMFDSSAPPANVITVSKANGDFSNPVAALNSITDASANKPYLVQIAPGRYEVSAPLVMKSHVRILGSGKGTTSIVRNITTSSSGVQNGFLVQFPSTTDNSAIGNLSLEVVGAYTNTSFLNALVKLQNSSSGVMHNVRVTVSTQSNIVGITADGAKLELIDSEINQLSIWNGLYADSVELDIVRSKISTTASATPVSLNSANNPSQVVVDSSTISYGNNTGLIVNQGTLIIRHSVIQASESAGNSISSGSGLTMLVEHSYLNGNLALSEGRVETILSNVNLNNGSVNTLDRSDLICNNVFNVTTLELLNKDCSNIE